MALNVATLVARVVADTSAFNAGMAGAESRLAATGRTMQATGRALTRTLTLPLVVTGAAAVKFAIDFQTQMTMIQTQAGATAHQMQYMKEQVLALAPATRYGPEELAKGLYHAFSVTHNTAQAMEILKEATKGAAVGNANLEDTVSALAGLMRVYHTQAGGVVGVMGDLNAIVGAGNMRMQDLNNAIATGLMPTTKGLGLSLRETGAVLATMTDESVPAQVAATRLRTLFLLMTGETKKSTDTLAKLGIGQLELGHLMRSPGGMIPALLDLKKHLDAFTKDPTLQTQFLAKAFGGARSSGTIIQLLNNLSMVQQKLAQINQTAGNFPSAVIATQATDAFKLHQAWAAIQTVLIQIGGIIAPVIVSMAQAVSRAAAAFGQLSPHLQGMIVISAAIAAAAGPILFVFGSLASLAALAATPVGLVVTALAALALVAGKLGVLREVAGMVIGAAVAFGVYTVAVGAADVATTLYIRALYAMDAALATNPLGLLAVGVGAVIGLFLTLSSSTDAETKALHAATAAIDAWSQAANRAHNQTLALKDTHLALLLAQDQVARSRQNLNRLEHTGSASALDLREAHHQLEGALLALAHANDSYKQQILKTHIAEKALKDTHDASVNSVEKLRQHYSALQKEMQTGIIQQGKHAGETITILGDKSKQAARVADDFAKKLEILAKHASEVVRENLKAHPAIAAAAAKIRDQALATEALTKKLHEVPDAVRKVTGAARAEASSLGAGIVAGVMAGIGGLGAQLAGSLSSQIAAAIASAKSTAQIHSPSEVTIREIGIPLAQGIIRGFLLGIRDLPSTVSQKTRDALEAGRKVVQQQQDKVSTAFRRYADLALRAFDASTQAHLDVMKRNFEAKIKAAITDPMNRALAQLDKAHSKRLDALAAAGQALTPAEQQLKSLQDAHDEAARQASIAQAKLALESATASGDPEAVKQAQSDLNEALYQEQIASLEQRAALERAARDASLKNQQDAENESYASQQAAIQAQYAAMEAAMQAVYDKQVLDYQAERDLLRYHLEQVLNKMEIELQKHPEKWKAYHKKIMKLFKDVFGPEYEEAGKNLGEAFAKGLREAQTAVGNAAWTLANMVKKYLQLKSPAETGPLSTLHEWWKPFARTLLRGLDSSSVNMAMNNMLTPSAATGRSSGGSSSLSFEEVLNKLADRLERNGPLIGEFHNHDEVDPSRLAEQVSRKLLPK